MERRFNSLMGLIPVWLAGCASVATVEQPVEPVSVKDASNAVVTLDPALAEMIHDPLSVSACQKTERDLSVDWQAKRYLCTHEVRRVALQQVNEGDYVAYQYRFKPLEKPQTVTEHAFITPVVARVQEAAQAVVRPVSFSQDAAPEFHDPQPTDTQLFRVWFPRNREVLGQKGIERLLEMIPAVANARQVTLLGVYEPSEIADTNSSSLDRERFSVGRALSVKNIWGREGLDLNNVRILHHQPARSGRFVEVTLND